MLVPDEEADPEERETKEEQEHEDDPTRGGDLRVGNGLALVAAVGAPPNIDRSRVGRHYRLLGLLVALVVARIVVHDDPITPLTS
jgi:hypothetical protein